MTNTSTEAQEREDGEEYIWRKVTKEQDQRGHAGVAVESTQTRSERSKLLAMKRGWI